MAHIIIILFVGVLLAVIGFIVLAKISNNSDSSKSNTTQFEESREKTRLANLNLEIPEWGTRIPLPDELDSLAVCSPTKTAYSTEDETAQVYSIDFVSSTWNCGDDSSGLIAQISRTTKDKRDGPYEPLISKKIGTYTYGLEVTNATNSDDPEYFSQLVAKFKETFPLLEQY